MTSTKPVIVIIGPTASGKTEVSIKLARHFNGEIISADSRQFYEHMDIGTAKPTNYQMTQTPHHLINVSQPEDIWSLARFKEAAMGCISDIHARGRLPFVVAERGSMCGLIEGWTIPEEPVDERLRRCLEIVPANWSKSIHTVLSG
jgi:tRNA dimethylallyltransferase